MQAPAEKTKAAVITAVKAGYRFLDTANDYDDDYYQKQKYYAEKKYSEDSDDKCTSEERDECCNAPEKKQWEVCIMLGCNLNKVSTNIN